MLGGRFSSIVADSKRALSPVVFPCKDFRPRGYVIPGECEYRCAGEVHLRLYPSRGVRAGGEPDLAFAGDFESGCFDGDVVFRGPVML
jgi:hypothetical protein